MDVDHIKNTVDEMICKQLGVKSPVTGMTFAELGADTLDRVEMVLMIEDELGWGIPADSEQEWKGVDGAVRAFIAACPVDGCEL